MALVQEYKTVKPILYTAYITRNRKPEGNDREKEIRFEMWMCICPLLIEQGYRVGQTIWQNMHAAAGKAKAVMVHSVH